LNLGTTEVDVLSDDWVGSCNSGDRCDDDGEEKVEEALGEHFEVKVGWREVARS
jgi:actin-like ATPase involved in cell morphogenesis